MEYTSTCMGIKHNISSDRNNLHRKLSIQLLILYVGDRDDPTFHQMFVIIFVDIKRWDHLLKPVSFYSITIQFHFNINSIDHRP